MIPFLLLGIALLSLFLAVLARALAQPLDENESSAPAPCTRADPRCIRTAQRLAEARAAMHSRGIVPLLSAQRPAWPRVSGVVLPFRK